MLTKDEKDRWLVALRSGNYRQGSGCLRHKNMYCCLGVLCDVIEPNGWGRPGTIGNLHRNETTFSHPFFNRNSGKPTELRIEDKDVLGMLIEMNDSGKYDFYNIADYIEKNVPCDS